MKNVQFFHCCTNCTKVKIVGFKSRILLKKTIKMAKPTVKDAEMNCDAISMADQEMQAGDG